MSKKFSMISEAQTRASTPQETIAQAKKIQEILGDHTSLTEAISLVENTFSRKITQADYNEWLRQVVLQAEFLRDSGTPINLNKRRQFDDVFSEVIENDPAGKVNPGDIGTVVAVSNILWGMYKQSKDHVRVNKAMAAREEEEAVYGGEGGLDVGQLDEPPAPSQDTRSNDVDSVPSRSVADDDYYSDEDDLDAEVDCPFDEGTPEYDAWMAGYEAGQSGGGAEVDADVDFDDDTEVDGDVDANFDDEIDIDADEQHVGQGDDAVRAEGDRVNRSNFEDEEDDYNVGYRDAKQEYHTGIRPSPKTRSERYERGYDDFMRNTEGQRELARRGAVEDEEQPQRKMPTLKDVLTTSGNIMKQELKKVERSGADAFRSLSLPSNPHPRGSMAYKAWARGMKNAAKHSFGVAEKPMPVLKKKKK